MGFSERIDSILNWTDLNSTDSNPTQSAYKPGVPPLGETGERSNESNCDKINHRDVFQKLQAVVKMHFLWLKYFAKAVKQESSQKISSEITYSIRKLLF